MESNISNLLQIKSPKDDEYNIICQMSDAEFGQNYLNSNDIKDILAQKGCCYIAKAGEQPVGFVLGYCDNENTGILKSIVVKQDFQGKGAGKALVRSALNHFRNLGCNKMQVIAWKRPLGNPIEHILNHLSFHFLHEISNYWLEESRSGKFICPVCGKNGCYCTARIYEKIF